MPVKRMSVLVAADKLDAELVKHHFPQLRQHVVLTPAVAPSDIRVGEYVWTPSASELPATVRLRLRGQLAPLIDDRSVEEEFPETLLSW